MLLERMAHIKKSSWHYRIVAKWHKIWNEKLVIRNLYEYWLFLLPMCLLFTAIMLAIFCAMIAGIGIIIYTMGAALVTHPARSLWDAFIFIGSIVCGVIAILLVSAVITVLSSWISAHSPKVKID